MGTLTRTTWTDDNGSGTTGSIINNAELQAIYAAVEGDIKSSSFPNVTTKSVQDNMLGGEIKHFGGDQASPVIATSYPSGATADKLHAGTLIWNVDSALLTGTYRLEGMLLGVGGITITAGIMNLSDGSPDTALAEISSTSTTGDRQRSSAITFPGGGAGKNYGIKTKVASGAGLAWGFSLVRSA